MRVETPNPAALGPTASDRIEIVSGIHRKLIGRECSSKKNEFLLGLDRRTYVR